MDDHLYLVTFDISDETRWRRVFKVMKGYGQWLQLSVFQCRLSRRRHAELIALLDGIIKRQHDALLLIDLGPADRVAPRVVSLGERFEPARKAVVIV